MIERLATHLLLRPEDIRPSHPDWEVIGVFNPGVVRHGDDTVILARVAERPREQRPVGRPIRAGRRTKVMSLTGSRTNTWSATTRASRGIYTPG